MEVVHKVIIDFARNDYTEIEVSKSKDRTVVLELCLLNHGEAVDLSAITMATIKAENAKGNKVFAEAEVLTDCVRYELSKTIVGTEGKTTCTLQVTDQGADTSNAFVFYVNVLTDLFDEDDYVAEDDITAVRSCMIRAENAAQSSEDNAAAVESQKEHLQKLTNETNETLSDCKEYMDTLMQRVNSGEFNGSQGIQGPQGEQGVQGPQGEQGEKGETGESGYIAPVNGIYSLSVDPDTGDVYVEYPDEGEVPEFSLEENGDVYIVTPEDRVYVGKVDLSGYVKDDDFATSETPGLVRCVPTYGIAVNTGNGIVSIQKATTAQIDAREELFRPITPDILDYSVMKSLTDPKKHDWTDKEKASVRALLSVETGASSYATVNNFTTAEEFENCITNNIPMYYVATLDDEEFAEDLGWEHYLIPYKASVGSEYYFTGILDWFTVNAVFDTSTKEWTLYYTDLATYDDIPTKVSELENDVGYGKKYVVVNDFSATTEPYEECINSGTVMYYKTRGYQNTLGAIGGAVTKDVYLIYNGSTDMLPSGKVYWFSGIYHGKALYAEIMVSDDFFTTFEFEVPIPTKISDLNNDSGYITDKGIFIATYGVTSYEEILEAYQANKGIILEVMGTRVGNGLMDLSMTLARVDNNNDASTDRYSFTFATDENGVSHWASINYATKKWNYWNYAYASALQNHDNQIVSLTNKRTVYKREEISANGSFKLRESGLYIFGGSDYDLNLCRADGSTVGKTKSLVVMVFCTEADESGAFRVYVMQNYKSTLGVPSMDGMPYDGFTRDCYIHNTNGSAGAYVYYMRQNAV